MKYLILGARGMAGHMIAMYLKKQGNEVVGFAKQPTPICETIVGDAIDEDLIKKIILSKGFDAVVNCIGILNKAVDKDIKTGIFINSYFPHLVAECCEASQSKFIHISSDCVFSGDSAGYVENDIPDAISYYGRTKYLGEVTNGTHLSFRTSIVGPEIKENGIGLFDWFMHQKGQVHGYANVIWSGVTTLELAKAVSAAVEKNLSGLYYLGNNLGISKCELLILFNEYCKNEKIEIVRDDEPISNRTLVCTRKDFQYQVPDYKSMIIEMGEWIRMHKTLYKRYMR